MSTGGSLAIRGIGDAYAFQRLLWLVVGTVVVPTALLALYGVVAIRNERHAMGERVRIERMERVEWALARVQSSLDRTSDEVHLAARACALPCALSVPGATAVHVWSMESPAPMELDAMPSNEIPIWTRSRKGAPWEVSRVGERFVAWTPDVAPIAQLIETETAARWPRSAPVVIEVSDALSPMETFDRWHSYRPVLPLEAPLDAYHLSIGPDDPQDSAFSKTSSLAGMGLVALVFTVLAGTFITMRAVVREIRLSRLQTDFVSNVSHELKTPLTSISMFVETLRSGRLQGDPERVEECLDLLASETDRLSRQIERVLSWARMEAGRRVYEVESVDAEDIVSEALAAFRSQRLHEADATDQIDVDLPEDLPPMLVDRDAIVEALLNLISNAVKYTPEPRRIRVAATEQRGRVGLSVQDNGPGIAPRDRRRIFEKFYQADTLLNRPVEGSGLGLSIVRAVVQAHRGKVELDSEPGKGSRFTLWLPAAP
ncbi:MAG: hypothetical protein EP330_25865 [Deltaproteobacteria bacterium]|nr:MAG: hypothetical protein EP330_25865 [Deltaproteobacteria bacterium]